MSTEKEFFPIVVVDDLREFPPEVDALHYKTYQDALDIIFRAHIGQLWLDHDLGTDPDTKEPLKIIPLVNKIDEANFSDDPPSIDEIIIHSSNPIGASEIERALNRWYKVRRVDPIEFDLKNRT